MRVLFFLLILGMIVSTNHIALAKAKARVHKKPAKQLILPTIYGAYELQNALNRLIMAKGQATDMTVFVKSMQTGDVLYRYNVNQPLTPASAMKIFTAESALLYLGPGYRFSTQLLTDAKSVKKGVLQGNLYIVLSGDPTLTYHDLADLFLSLKTQQIRAIAGNVYIDDTAYDQRFYGPGWQWEDKNYCYAAPIGAGIVNRNCLSFQVAPSKVSGRAATVMTSPNYYYPTIRNGVVTKTSRSRHCSVRLSGDPGNAITIDGCMPKGRYAWGVSYVINDLPEYNRSLFKNLLYRLSVSIYGRVTFRSIPDNLSLIGSHSSKPLPILINEMLKKSDNIIAGALFKKIGQLYTRQQGSWENGSFAVSQILAKRAGVNISGMRILDGSGLSPDNLATGAQMMQVLNFAYHHGPTSNEFITALPIAGVDGTLKHRLGHIARKVRAKTGTISGVVSLAGYAMSKDKELLAFVIMINGNRGLGWRYKSLEDSIATALTRYTRELT